MVKEAVKKVVESVKFVKGDERSFGAWSNGPVYQQQQQRRRWCLEFGKSTQQTSNLEFNKIGQWTSDLVFGKFTQMTFRTSGSIGSKMSGETAPAAVSMKPDLGENPTVMLDYMETIPYKKAKEISEDYEIKTEACILVPQIFEPLLNVEW